METQTTPSSPLFLEKKQTELVKPSKHTTCETFFLSTLDNDPLNEVMYATIYVFKANEKNPNDPVSVLRKALSKLLLYYYPLSGKLMRRKSDRKLQLVCWGEGVPFTVATAAPDDLRSLNYIENLDEKAALLLVPDIDLNYECDIGYHPLAFQVTKFSCGGFTLGTAVSHAVCDGFGVAQVLHALTELASGRSKVSIIPVWQREQLKGEIDNEPAIAPGGDLASLMATPYYTMTVNIKAGNIKRLKDDTTALECDLLKESFTTFEVLSAYIWKSRSRALKLNLDGITVLGISVGIRHVLDPPLPNGYYGNAYIDVYVELTARKLDESSLSDIAMLIKKAKKTAYNKEYIEKELKNTERLIRDDVQLEGRNDGLLFLTDWRNIGLFGSMDFGWNEPVNMRPLTPLASAKNTGMILKPSKLDPSMEGGVKVVMTLPRDAMVTFKQEMDAINKL